MWRVDDWDDEGVAASVGFISSDFWAGLPVKIKEGWGDPEGPTKGCVQ